MTNKIQYSKKFADGTILVVGADTVEEWEQLYQEFRNSEVVLKMFKEDINGNSNVPSIQHDDMNQDPSYCPIHKVTMKQYEKDGRSWFSHKTDDGWCKGK